MNHVDPAKALAGQLDERGGILGFVKDGVKPDSVKVEQRAFG